MYTIIQYLDTYKTIPSLSLSSTCGTYDKILPPEKIPFGDF